MEKIICKKNFNYHCKLSFLAFKLWNSLHGCISSVLSPWVCQKSNWTGHFWHWLSILNDYFKSIMALDNMAKINAWKELFFLFNWGKRPLPTVIDWSLPLQCKPGLTNSIRNTDGNSIFMQIMKINVQQKKINFPPLIAKNKNRISFYFVKCCILMPLLKFCEQRPKKKNL